MDDLLIALQIAGQSMALMGTYMLGSKSPNKRLQGFVMLTLGNIPLGALFYLTDLYVNIMLLPLWIWLNVRGILNALKVIREDNELDTDTGGSHQGPEGQG